MDINEQIRAMLAEHPIVLFMKGTPQFPMCGFSSRAVQALTQAGAEFLAVNVLADPQIRAALPHFANWPTFPQLFIQGELIGGCDISGARGHACRCHRGDHRQTQAPTGKTA